MNSNQINKEIVDIFGKIKMLKHKSNRNYIYQYENILINIIKNNPLVNKRRFIVFFDDLVLSCLDEVGRNDYTIKEEEFFQLSLIENINVSYNQLQKVKELYKKLGNVKFRINLNINH